MNHLSAILCGFSIVVALILLSAYLFFLDGMKKSAASKSACAGVLLGIAALQFAHFQYFVSGTPVLEFRIYGVVLASIPGAFFFFSRQVLSFGASISAIDTVHLIPALAALLVPVNLVPPLAFFLGAIYTFLFAQKVVFLRRHTHRFRFEAFFFGLFFLLAVIALVLGLALPLLDHAVYYHVYAWAIALSLILVVTALLVFPELLSDVQSISETAYANSKLTGVNVEDKRQALEKLMYEDRQFENEDLTLGNIAELLELSSHQLSELVNTQYGYGFPRFIREHRVNAAKIMLIEKPQASVLSIGLATGFRSQSSFYTAFKEITGLSPGAYRKTEGRPQ